MPLVICLFHLHTFPARNILLLTLNVLGAHMQHICEGYLLCVRCCAGDLSFLLFSPPLHFLDLFIAQRITELLLCVQHCGTE